MHIKRVTFLLAALSLVLTTMIGPASAMADSRCNGGKGIQIWQDGNLGGATTKFCANSNSVIAVTPLSNETGGLSFFANWDNRISSYQTFNNSSGWTCLYKNNNYGTEISAAYKSDTIEYVGDAANDQASSIYSPC
ncbi:MAG: hypothetical protein U0838_00780 [Chloroflexota bacterium]